MQEIRPPVESIHSRVSKTLSKQDGNRNDHDRDGEQRIDQAYAADHHAQLRSKRGQGSSKKKEPKTSGQAPPRQASSSGESPRIAFQEEPTVPKQVSQGSMSAPEAGPSGIQSLMSSGSRVQHPDILVDNRPSDYEYAVLSEHVYGGETLKPGDRLPDNAQWKVHAVQSGGRGYFSAIYINDEIHQIVLAYRGTNSWQAGLEDIQGIVRNALSTQKKEAFYFVEKAKALVKAKSNLEQPYHLSFTGHSLGAFLAELSVFYAHKDYSFVDVNAVTFESPGSKNSMEKMQSNLQPMDLRRLDIVGYVAYPNFINTWNEHVGTLYQINPNLDDIKTNLLYWITGTNHTIQAHAMKGILKHFKELKHHVPSRLYMSDWPLFSQRSIYFDYFERKEGHYVLKEEYKARSQFSLSYECHYSYDESLSGWNRLPLRHFSPDLQVFLKAFHQYKWMIAPYEQSCQQLAERWKQLTIPEEITIYLLNYQVKKDSSGLIILELDSHKLKEAGVHAFRRTLSRWLKSNGRSLIELLTLPSREETDLLPDTYQSLKSSVEVVAAIIAAGAELAQGGEFEDINVRGIHIDIPEDMNEQTIRYLERLSNAVLFKTNTIETYGIAPEAKIGGPIHIKRVDIKAVELGIKPRPPESVLGSHHPAIDSPSGPIAGRGGKAASLSPSPRRQETPQSVSVLSGTAEGSVHIHDTQVIAQQNVFYASPPGGTLPKGPIWFEIGNRLDAFTGREQALKKLHEQLNQVASGAERELFTVIAQTVSVSALGGIGKTTLAREYAHRYGREYDGNVIWLNAATLQTLSESFRRLAKDKLGISIKDADGEDKAIQSLLDEVYQYFSKKKSLFIFDNAEPMTASSEGIVPFLPSSSPEGRKDLFILVTSRNQNWGKTVHVISLEKFTPEEAHDFVKNALSLPEEVGSLDNEIEKLTKTLDYFPLALQQAVAYIAREHEAAKNKREDYTIRDYLMDYSQKSKKLKKLLDSLAKDYRLDDYGETIFKTWDITLDKIKRKTGEHNEKYGQQALAMLHSIAYLSPDDIPTELFHGLEEIKAGQVVDVGHAVQLLKDYSMVNTGEKLDGLTVHRLVQQVIRLQLKEGKQEEARLQKTLELLKPLAGDNRTRYIPHVLSVWNYALLYTPLIKKLIVNAAARRSTPLHIIAGEGQPVAMQAIVEAVENQYPQRWYELQSTLSKVLSAQDEQGRTPLHEAVYRNNRGTVQVLLDSVDGNPDLFKKLVLARDNDELTLLDLAAKEMTQYLQERMGATLFEELLLTLNKRRETSLHRAAKQSVARVEKLLERVKGNPDCVKRLIRALDWEKKTPLHWAANAGNPDVVRALVEQVKDQPDLLQPLLLAPDKDGKTPLHWAANAGNPDVVRALVEPVKDQPDLLQPILLARDQEGKTPLHWAANAGKFEVVRALVEQVKNELDFRQAFKLPLCLYLKTPLHEAANANKLFRALVERLKDQPDLIQPLLLAPDKDGKTPLHWAANAGNPDVVRALVKPVKDQPDLLQPILLAPDKDGKTPLHWAANAGNPDVVRALVKPVKDQPDLLQPLLLAPDKDGKTPLNWAANAGNPDVVRALVEPVKDQPDLLQPLLLAPDKDGKTPLHWAAFARKLEVVRALVEQVQNELDFHQAFELPSCPYLKTPLHEAANELDFRQAFELPSYLYLNTPLHEAANANKLFRALVEPVKDQTNPLQALLLASDQDEETPLHSAANANMHELVQALVEPVEDQTDPFVALLLAPDQDGKAPLHSAANANMLALDLYRKAANAAKPELVRALVEPVKDQSDILKAVMLATDQDGKTPLHEAVVWSNLEVVRALVKLVKDQPDLLQPLLLAQDQYRKTPLHWAANDGMPELVKDQQDLLKAFPLALDLYRKAANADKPELVRALVEPVKDQPDFLQPLLLAPDKDGKTALHWAANAGNPDVVRALVEPVKDQSDILKALMLATDQDGKTPLHEAVVWRKLEVVLALLKSVQEPAVLKDLFLAKNTKSETIAQLAKRGGNQKIIDLVEQFQARALSQRVPNHKHEL